MKIVFTGGGTGGHIFPCIAIIREMKKIKSGSSSANLKIYYFGPKDEFAKELLAKEGIDKIYFVCSGKLRRYFDIRNFIDIFKFIFGFFQSLWHFFWLAPDLTFSCGGYGSLPVAFASKVLGTPIFLHEADTIPGLASRIQARFAKEVFTSFQDTKLLDKKKIIIVGNPVRQEILNGSFEEAKRVFNLQGKKPVALFIGGSQGAMAINNLVVDLLMELLNDFEIIHQTGKKNFKEVSLQTNFILEGQDVKKFYHIVDFLSEEQLKNALNSADIIVSRAGSGAIFEIAACKKPAILVPLKWSAQEHQLENAYQFSQTGACEVNSEENLTPHFFLQKLRFLISRKDLLLKMSQGAYNFSRVKTANIIASYLLDYLYQTLEG